MTSGGRPPSPPWGRRAHLLPLLCKHLPSHTFQCLGVGVGGGGEEPRGRKREEAGGKIKKEEEEGGRKKQVSCIRLLPGCGL